ncbi:MAG: type II toxin-antitoxin system RelE/ParE family toxin [Treponema sp.]|jgi:proteic killer suppression protein|nr:type II toxin-antitoxin system RelE/ParE family toxin [Treponema sp.]
MIQSFKHKGLEQFFKTGTKKGIQFEHAGKIARILDRLDASISPADMNLPGYRLHELKGQETGTWSVTVNANWRITFQFKDKNVVVVDYQDYH